MMEALSRRLKINANNFHNFLHVFWAGRSTGTATLGVKLLQCLAALREEFLYVILLDLHKVYAALDSSR